MLQRSMSSLHRYANIIENVVHFKYMKIHNIQQRCPLVMLADMPIEPGSCFCCSSKCRNTYSRNLFSSKQGDYHGSPDKKELDDYSDMNVDFETQLNWLTDIVTQDNSGKTRKFSSINKLKLELNPSGKLQNELPDDATHSGYDSQKNSSLLQSSKNKKRKKSVVSLIIPPYRCDNSATFTSHREPRQLTSDVAVEIVTCQLKALFGYDRFCAHRIAKWLRRSFVVRAMSAGRDVPLHEYAAAPVMQELEEVQKLIENAVETAKFLKSIDTPCEVLYKVPMLIKVPKEDLQCRLPLVMAPDMFPSSTAGLPLLLLTEAQLMLMQLTFQRERRWLVSSNNRFDFLARTLQVDVTSLCCAVVRTFMGRLLRCDLTHLAKVVDLLNYYRVSRSDILVYPHIFFYRAETVHTRLSLTAAKMNSPRVLDALRAATPWTRDSWAELALQSPAIVGDTAVHVGGGEQNPGWGYDSMAGGVEWDDDSKAGDVEWDDDSKAGDVEWDDDSKAGDVEWDDDSKAGDVEWDDDSKAGDVEWDDDSKEGDVEWDDDCKAGDVDRSCSLNDTTAAIKGDCGTRAAAGELEVFLKDYKPPLLYVCVVSRLMSNIYVKRKRQRPRKNPGPLCPSGEQPFGDGSV